ncbi:MAG: c-type cytochrome [Planctomycetaceae bacterium]|nr:c-type cytochrome [Planctomycetaceae bacterium]
MGTTSDVQRKYHEDSPSLLLKRSTMHLRVILLTMLSLLTGFSNAADRVPWTTSNVVGSPEPPRPFHVSRVYPRLRFNQPVELMPLGKTNRMMMLEVGGKLWTFVDDPTTEQADLAIDLKPLIDNFTQSYGFAIHPNFDNNRQVFIAYAGGPKAREDGTRLSRFALSEDSPPTIDPASEEVLLTWPSGGHNGCAIRFDSKGLLYFSAGDGARPYPPDEYDVSQDLSDLRSTICRIDVDHAQADKAYRIPEDNPFIGTPGARPEIWAYGFRNPWRFTIDPVSDRMLVGDVGWELWEMIYDVQRAGNYGWSIHEGPQPIRSDIEPGPTPIQKPVVAYPHTVGQSVTGGVIYHGDQFTDLSGAYLYGDYVTGLLWGWQDESAGATWNPVLAETGLKIITITTNRAEEVLIVDYDGGIYELIRNPDRNQQNSFPQTLSSTGLFASTETLEPAPGVFRYELVAQSWQGRVSKDFVVAIPGTETINISRQRRNWKYPTGTVFANTISRPADNPQDPPLRLETQLLHFDGMSWQPYSYAWDEQQRDAKLVPETGMTIRLTADDQPWPITSRSQCRACHARQSGGAIGFSLENLPDPMVQRFVSNGILNNTAPNGWGLQKMVDPAKETEDIHQRARSYLAANCAHCHRRGGGGTVPLDLVYSLPTTDINALDVVPTQGDFGIHDAKVIRPGNPYESVLYYRLATSGSGRMPKIWSRDNDTAGLKLIHDWIASLDANRFAQLSNDSTTTTPTQATTDALQHFATLINLAEADAESLAEDTSQHATSPIITGIFERFLPANQRRKRLGALIDADEILALPGDPKRGREWFFDSQQGQCVSCHRLQGGGRSVGPDLDGIAVKRSREQLLESLLDPSKTIEPAFQSFAVLTDTGTVVTGLKVAETDSHWTLRQADGKDIHIARETIESSKPQTQSLMPTGLAAEMTAEELADLLAFLQSLK